MSGILLSLQVIVGRKTRETNDVCGFELRPLAGGSLPPFTAGAHIDVEVAPGLLRQYSLCNPPSDRSRYQIAVLNERNSRGGSKAMAEEVREGQVLNISAPRNHFSLAADGRRARLFAGGIGITPIIAMAEQLHAESKPFMLHYASRSKDAMAFHDRIKASPFAASVSFHFDDEAGGPMELASRVRSPAEGEHLYVCGPPGFIKAVLEAARPAWPQDHLHREHFSASNETNSSPDRPFFIQAGFSGAPIPVPAGKSALSVLRENGFNVPSSCEQGVCGTCLVNVLEGKPDHRDQVLTDDEKATGSQIALCCSRSNSDRLVIDISS